MKDWPSKESSFRQHGGPRGGSKAAPERAFPSDVETQVTVKVTQSFASHWPGPAQHWSLLQDHVGHSFSFSSESKLLSKLLRITEEMGRFLCGWDYDWQHSVLLLGCQHFVRPNQSDFEKTEFSPAWHWDDRCPQVWPEREQARLTVSPHQRQQRCCAQNPASTARSLQLSQHWAQGFISKLCNHLPPPFESRSSVHMYEFDYAKAETLLKAICWMILLQ